MNDYGRSVLVLYSFFIILENKFALISYNLFTKGGIKAFWKKSI